MSFDYMMPEFRPRAAFSFEFAAYLRAEFKKTVIPSLRKK